MAEVRLQLLMQKRITVKNHLIKFEEFLDNYNAESEFSELQIRLQTIYRIFSNFDDFNDEIVVLDPEVDHSREREDMQRDFFKLTSKAHSLIPDFQFAPPAGNRNDLNQSFSTNSNHSENQVFRRKIKLPTASLPTFSGKYEEWISFKQSFSTLIHDNEELNEVEKLHYLRSALKDEALRKIQVLAITEENYLRAWSLLVKSYEDTRMLISRHLSLLLRLPTQEKEYAKGLMILADESQQHVQSLATIGIEITPEIVVQIIEDKLHKNTLEKWEETLKRGEYPKLEDLIDFLYQTAGRLSKRKSDSERDSNNKSHPSKQPKLQAKGHAFIIKTKKCPHCSESHYIWRCETFRKLSVTDRIKAVKSMKLCTNCLSSHLGKPCKFGVCPKCNKRHNSLLHLDTETSNTEKST